MKNLKLILLGWTGLTLALAGCGGYGSSSAASTEAAAILSADKVSAVVGDQIHFDATGSVYDTISWTLNGAPVTDCSDVQCSVTMSSEGSFEVAINLKTAGNSNDRASLIVSVGAVQSVASAKKTTTESSSSGSHSNSQDSSSNALDAGTTAGITHVVFSDFSGAAW